MYPWDVRATTELDTPDADLPDYDLWFRTPEVCSHLAPALTAYATDLNIIGTALRQVPDITQRDAQTRFRSAVTTHTLSFHRPFRTDQGWLLLRHHSPIVAHGRAWGRGDVYTESGDLAASFSQESLVRFNT
jgi:acyl-CoA thioesterase-2